MPLINSSLGAWCQIVHTSLPIVCLCSCCKIVSYNIGAKLSLSRCWCQVVPSLCWCKIVCFRQVDLFLSDARFADLVANCPFGLHIYCLTLIHNSILNIQTILFASKYGRIDADGWFQDQTQTKFILHICGSSICWAWGAITKADKVVCLMFSLCLLSPWCTGNLTKNFKWLSPIRFQMTISDYISLWINNG